MQDWSEHQPSTQKENEYLQEHGFGEYGKWYLGIDTEEDEDNNRNAVRMQDEMWSNEPMCEWGGGAQDPIGVNLRASFVMGLRATARVARAQGPRLHILSGITRRCDVGMGLAPLRGRYFGDRRESASGEPARA